MTRKVTLHVRAREPEAMATLEALLSREELVALRNRTAEALWQGQIAEGQLSLRWLHRESRWKSPADRSADEFVRVHQGMALIDMLDLLIAGLRVHDHVKVDLAADDSPMPEALPEGGGYDLAAGAADG
jgi:hypothetical protein